MRKCDRWLQSQHFAWTSLAHLGSNLYFGTNCSHHNAHLCFFLWVQKPDAQISMTTMGTRTEGGLPMIITIDQSWSLRPSKSISELSSLSLNYSLNPDTSPKSDGTSGSISKEATIGLEKCDLSCSLGSPNPKVLITCQTLWKRWKMIGLLPVYMYVSRTTKELKIIISWRRERKNISRHFMTDSGAVTWRLLRMVQG